MRRGGGSGAGEVTNIKTRAEVADAMSPSRCSWHPAGVQRFQISICSAICLRGLNLSPLPDYVGRFEAGESVYKVKSTIAGTLSRA